MKIKTVLTCALMGLPLAMSAYVSSANASIGPIGTQNVVGQSRPYDAIIRTLANAHHIPVDLVHAVVQIESNYNPNARGTRGEIGLMQILPATARALGFTGPIANLYKPSVNLEYGMRYLSQALKLSNGDTCRTILKYNAGHGASHMNPVSRRYCAKVQTYLASVQ